MTPPSDTHRWLKISAHLDRALDLSPLEREAWLQELRAADPEMASDLAAMLAEHRQLRAEGFLDSSPIAKNDASLGGVTIGSYTLISRIGDGGMGSVWLGRRSDGRYEGQVAIKLLNASLVGRGGEERFRREGIILGRLGHPHIAQPDRRGRLEHRPALPCARARQRRAHRHLSATSGACRSIGGFACFSTCCRPSRTRTPTSSSIAISNPRTCSSTKPAR